MRIEDRVRHERRRTPELGDRRSMQDPRAAGARLDLRRPACPAPPRTRRRCPGRRTVVTVSLSAMPIVVVVDVAEIDAALQRARAERPRRPPAPRAAACRSTCAFVCVEPETRELDARGSASTRARAPAIAFRPSGPVIHARTSPPCSPAAPARCRCSTSPSRGGCAARAWPAPCGTPCVPWTSTDTPMIRPGIWRTNAWRVAKNAGVRPAVSERHAEPLRVAEHDVGAHLSWRREQRQRQQVGADRDEHAGVVRAGDERRQVLRRAPYCVRILQQRAEDARLERHRVHRPDVQIDAERLGARAQDVDRLRKTAIADEEQAAFPCARRPAASNVRGAAASSPRPPPSPHPAATRSPPPSPSAPSPSSGN